MYTRFHSYRLSSLLVGTAQFGMEYGIANERGKPPYGAIRAIVEKALQSGVNSFDTAALYGDSEVVLGQALEELGSLERVFVVTKLPWLEAGELERAGSAERFVLDSVRRSLDRLRLEKLPLCLLHRFADSKHLPALLAAREQGLIGHAGVSVYSPAEAREALRTPGVEAIQLPTSVLDLRFWRAGVFDEARRRGVTVFARSIYLQGLLFLPGERIPEELHLVRAVRRELGTLADRWAMSLAEMALRLVLSLRGVGGVVVGMENSDQCEANVRFWQKGKLAAECLEEVLASVPDLPERVLNPSLWPRRRGGGRA